MKIHASALAAPSQCVNLKDIWLCSSTNRIACAVNQQDLVRQLLGWNKPVSGRNAALQLLTCKDIFDKSYSTARDKIAEVYVQNIPRLLLCLESALAREGAREVDQWMKVLRDKAVLWVQDRFVEANRIAFKSLSGFNTEPFLFTISGEQMKYQNLLRALGVRESFGAMDLASMMREFYASNRDTPLPPSKVEVCIGILKVLVKLQQGEANVMQAEAKELSPSSEGDKEKDLDEGAAAAGGGEMLKSSAVKAVAVATARVVVKETSLTMEDLGPIYIPDRNSVLEPAGILSFDDAPWISKVLVNKNSTFKFVHKGLSIEDAIALGARSLREQLFAGDEIVCPDAMLLKANLNLDSCSETLNDLLSLGDQCGARSMHVCLDMRFHPSESLMHPGLADAQGPALCVFIDGPTLSSEEISQMLLPPQLFVNVEMGDDGPSLARENSLYPCSGKRMMSSFAMTDCLQIVTGREFFIFDPCGTHLLSMGSDTELSATHKKSLNQTKPSPSTESTTASTQNFCSIAWRTRSKSSHTHSGTMTPIRKLKASASNCISTSKR